MELADGKYTLGLELNEKHGGTGRTGTQKAQKARNLGSWAFCAFVFACP
jgi:hypothetical protein